MSRRHPEERAAWAAFTAGAPLVKFGYTTVSRDGDAVVFSNPGVPRFRYRPATRKALAAAWIGFRYLVLGDAMQAQLDRHKSLITVH